MLVGVEVPVGVRLRWALLVVKYGLRMELLLLLPRHGEGVLVYWKDCSRSKRMLFEYILFLKGQKEDDMTKSDQKILLAARIVKFYSGDNDSI